MLVKKTHFSIVRVGRLLAVSRSGYYAWLGRAPWERAVRHENIEQKVTCFHSDSDEVYGSPRILADLRADAEVISRKTVATTMHRLGLLGINPKRWLTTTVSQAKEAYPVDAANGSGTPGPLNQVRWATSPTVGSWKGGSIWLPSSTRTRAASPVGRSPTTCSPTSSMTPWSWPWPSAVTDPSRSYSTPIGAPNTRQHRSPCSRKRTESPVDGLNGRLLGQRDCENLLCHAQDRALPSMRLAQQKTGPPESKTATAGAADTSPSAKSAPSISNCNTFIRKPSALKPHDPVSTNRGKARSRA